LSKSPSGGLYPNLGVGDLNRLEPILGARFTRLIHRNVGSFLENTKNFRHDGAMTGRPKWAMLIKSITSPNEES